MLHVPMEMLTYEIYQKEGQLEDNFLFGLGNIIKNVVDGLENMNDTIYGYNSGLGGI